ncbi:MAG: homocysteine S-methyltransferase family protein [Tissierellales bacterium]|nr:homocysteine S-methyltransferase family protein [Tissierellales bacterium]
MINLRIVITKGQVMVVTVKINLLDKIWIFDGAMGTMLQNDGLEIGGLPEILNIEASEKVVNIHKRYIEAGADFITTNTFGANEIKLKNSSYEVEDVIDAAIKNAKLASDTKDVKIVLDIGPIGEMLEPLGTLAFERAYDIFKRQILQGVKSGADIILIETMSDLYEAKAAILAAKENSDLPVFCTMTFEKNKRTFAGVNVKTMVMTLEGLNVDALGVNCSLGPVELESVIEEVMKYASIPVIVQPNAGLPRMSNGETIYDLSSDEFASAVEKMVKSGVNIVGGCCGTTNEFIKSLSIKFKDTKPYIIERNKLKGVCSALKCIEFEGIKVIGERINPTGKKLFKEALKNNNIEYIVKQALEQIEAGADILDVNVGLPEIDEEKMMVQVIKELQTVVDVPLQIDSNNSKVLEGALRVYNGKAIVNSVNGKDLVLDRLLPIVKKYGAAIIGLTLDEDGIPSSAEDRFRIAEKIVDRCLSLGIPREDIIIDCLTLTASAQQKDVIETLKAIELVKARLNVKTVLGVSNVSFGLPNRNLLNRTFLSMALYSGLDFPIVNPNDVDIMDTISAFKVLSNEDYNSKKYVSNFENQIRETRIIKKENVKRELDNEMDNSNDELIQVIIKGLKEESAEITKNILKKKTEIEVVNEILIPALNIVGEKYEKGEIFLPQLIQSAETVKCSFDVIQSRLILNDENRINRGTIILATVKGDIHDIGKNIVKTVLENYGFEIIDLGKDVSKEKIVEEAKEKNVKLVGLSALMTTTVKSMEETIKALKSENIKCKIFVGGAVLNQEYADMIDADYYAKDAKEAVEIAEKIFFDI